MVKIPDINIRKPGLRIWSLLFCPDKSLTRSRRLYWFRVEHMRGPSNGGRTPLHSLSACTVWEPRDLWVGVYWVKESNGLILFVCALPCLPLRLHFKKEFGAGGVS